MINQELVTIGPANIESMDFKKVSSAQKIYNLWDYSYKVVCLFVCLSHFTLIGW